MLELFTRASKIFGERNRTSFRTVYLKLRKTVWKQFAFTKYNFNSTPQDAPEMSRSYILAHSDNLI